MLLNLASLVLGNTGSLAIPTNGSIITVDDDKIDCPNADYAHIQDAINAAEIGDTIHVYSGLYKENIIINKQITLVGMTNNESTMPIICPLNSNSTVIIKANRCNLQKFKLIGDDGYLEAALKILSNNNIIENNFILNYSFYGIDLYRSNNNILENNSISDNNWGIRLQYSYKNIIKNNNLIDNWIGIWIDHSSLNTVQKNNIFNCYYGISIIFRSNANNIMSNNIINSTFSIDFFKSDCNKILYNTVHISALDGIRIYGSKLTIVKYNNISNSGYHAIRVLFCSIRQIIEGNNIINNTVGISLESYSVLNKIIHNNFIDNNISATFEMSYCNRWSENYWSDFSGFGPYSIYGKINIQGMHMLPWIVYDRHPLTEPFVH